MSRKTRKNQRKNSQIEGSGENTVSSVMNSTKETLNGVASSANRHRLLVGSVLAGSAAGIALMTTQSGKRIRNSVGSQIGSMYTGISGKVSEGWNQLRGVSQRMIPSHKTQEGLDSESEAKSRFVA